MYDLGNGGGTFLCIPSKKLCLELRVVISLFFYRFRVKIELVKCPPRKQDWKQQYRIYAVGVPDSILFNVETLCDCPCENTKGVRAREKFLCKITTSVVDSYLLLGEGAGISGFIKKLVFLRCHV